MTADFKVRVGHVVLVNIPLAEIGLAQKAM